ncbi:MAG: hypothetical protein QOH36_203 [Actinomycetota bacterium]|nr:hypothetical protein [Actinomycetota bacterium]
MKVRIPVFVKDPVVSALEGIDRTELITIEDQDIFLDGPVSTRVAILDFDESGALRPGAQFVPAKTARGAGSYAVSTNKRAASERRMAPVSVFGVVHKTIQMFEEPDALGRRVDWAFDSPQLLVVPFAGDWANAFYDRSSQSLQFFSFTGPDDKPVNTCFSQDIVAHETGHAILDGIAPDLYDATTPQALAMHEAIADVVAVIAAFRSRKLRDRVLAQKDGDISDSSAFSGLAGQFSEAQMEGKDYLRNLKNDAKIEPGLVEPHALSEVLSGALYGVVLKLYDRLRGAGPAAEAVGDDDPDEASAGKALFMATERYKRFVIRGLDYLPPGDASFADLGRAMVAADLATYPESKHGAQRDWLADEFVTRRIVKSRAALTPKLKLAPEAKAAIAGLDLEALVTSDYYAYEFVRANRELFQVPDTTSFEVRKRLDVTKKEWHGDLPPTTRRECLVKVAWTEQEANDVEAKIASRRTFRRGTTLAIDWETHAVRGLLTTENSPAAKKSRSALIRRLIDNDELALAGDGIGPDGEELSQVVHGDLADGTLRVRNTGRSLHVIGGR